MLNMMNSFCNLVNHKSATPKVVALDIVIIWQKVFLIAHGRDTQKL